MLEEKRGRGRPKGKMKEPEFNPNAFMWHVRPYCKGASLCRTILYELIKSGVVDTVRIGGSRMITTPPDELIARLKAKAAAKTVETPAIDILSFLEAEEGAEENEKPP